MGQLAMKSIQVVKSSTTLRGVATRLPNDHECQTLLMKTVIFYPSCVVAILLLIWDLSARYSWPCTAKVSV